MFESVEATPLACRAYREFAVIDGQWKLAQYSIFFSSVARWNKDV
jgi:hypothetical protein